MKAHTGKYHLHPLRKGDELSDDEWKYFGAWDTEEKAKTDLAIGKHERKVLH